MRSSLGEKKICHVSYCHGDCRKSSDLFHGSVRVLTVTTFPIPKSSFCSQMRLRLEWGRGKDLDNVTIRESDSVLAKIEIWECVFLCTGSHGMLPSVRFRVALVLLLYFLSLAHMVLTDAFASDEEKHYAWMKVGERWVWGWDYAGARR